MKNDLITSLILSGLVISLPTRAETKRFILGRDSFSLQIPHKWQSAYQLYGLPLVVLGPYQNGSRPVIYVAASGISVNADADALAASEKDYRDERTQWLEQVQGFPVRFFPYEKASGKKGVEFHRVGVSYRLRGVLYSEHSYYTLCRGKLFHLKSLLNADQLASFEGVAEKIVGSFECANPI